ncbi:MAG: geranylgeranyl pyrophosphate synthase [Myxococcota bacterium]|jgi:geranylgeranyl pyrophosphate synthase
MSQTGRSNASSLPTSIADALARWRTPILSTIATVVAPPAREGDGSLADMIHYHIGTGGKRLRPLIALMAAEALGADPERVLPFAAGVELLHNATLVHDDYQDGDRVRRGRPTIWVRDGWEQSINAGDGLYFAGMALLARAQTAPQDMPRLVEMTSRRMLQVIEGQVNEFRLKNRFASGESVSEADYIDVIRGKTAGLFALPLEGGGICAGRPHSEVEGLAIAGDLLGLLFQVQDDLLDLIGDKGRGQVGTDIAEGKPSLPVVRALSQANEGDAQSLLTIVRRPREETSEADIAQAMEILEGSGAIESSLATVREWRSQIVAGHPDLGDLLTDVTTAVINPIADRI